MAAAEHKEIGDSQALSPQEGAVPRPLVPALRAAMPAPVAKRRLWLWAGSITLALALAAFVGSQFWMARPSPAVVEIAAFAPVTRVLAVNGRIAAAHSVDVKSLVSGTIVALPVAEGDFVAVGQTLAQIDDAAQNAVLRQAIAALDAAIVRQQQATETYQRTLALGANVPATVLEADAHAVQLAAQEVARLTALMDQAQIVLQTYTIRAPAAGTVVALDAEIGQITSPSAHLMTLADLSTLLVEADVDEAYAAQIAVGQKAVLQLAGQTGTQDGGVTFVSKQVNAATGGLAIKISFDTPLAAPIGLTVAANIIMDQRAAALTVPRTSMLTGADGTSVFVVAQGVAQQRPIAVVDWPAARLIVTSGLREGDAVITDATGITDGQSITAEQP